MTTYEKDGFELVSVSLRKLYITIEEIFKEVENAYNLYKEGNSIPYIDDIETFISIEN